MPFSGQNLSETGLPEGERLAILNLSTIPLNGWAEFL